MKKLLISVLLSFTCISSATVFINEIHYDNVGGDVGEGFELANSNGAATQDMTGWTVELYNGSNGTVYNTIDVSSAGMLAGGTTSSFFTLPANGLQNGAPDGMALIDNMGAVVEFISYEGQLTATAGAANGMMSTDIGVAETNSTTIGDSLQRTDDGTGAAVWTGPIPGTPGAENTGQMLPVELQNFSVE